MVKAELTVMSPGGLHLIPANKIANEAELFKSKISFRRENMVVNAKSILNIVSGCFREGDCFICVCEGEDEKEALEKMKEIMALDLS